MYVLMIILYREAALIDINVHILVCIYNKPFFIFYDDKALSAERPCK